MKDCHYCDNLPVARRGALFIGCALVREYTGNATVRFQAAHCLTCTETLEDPLLAEALAGLLRHQVVCPARLTLATMDAAVEKLLAVAGHDVLGEALVASVSSPQGMTEKEAVRLAAEVQLVEPD